MPERLRQQYANTDDVENWLWPFSRSFETASSYDKEQTIRRYAELYIEDQVRSSVMRLMEHFYDQVQADHFKQPERARLIHGCNNLIIHIQENVSLTPIWDLVQHVKGCNPETARRIAWAYTYPIFIEAREALEEQLKKEAERQLKLVNDE